MKEVFPVQVCFALRIRNDLTPTATNDGRKTWRGQAHKQSVFMGRSFWSGEGSAVSFVIVAIRRVRLRWKIASVNASSLNFNLKLFWALIPIDPLPTRSTATAFLIACAEERLGFESGEISRPVGGFVCSPYVVRPYLLQ